MKKRLTPKEASQYSGFNYRKLVHLDETGALPANRMKSGKTDRRYYTKDQLDNFLNDKETTAKEYHSVKTRISGKADIALKELAKKNNMKENRLARLILENTLLNTPLDFLDTTKTISDSRQILKKMSGLENIMIDILNVIDDSSGSDSEELEMNNSSEKNTKPTTEERFKELSNNYSQ